MVVAFRHGARTPVFLNEAMQDIPFPLCSQSCNSALREAVVRHEKGGAPPPLSENVQRQRDHQLPGGQCFGGQLTDLGINQTIALGEALRARYGQWLDPAQVTVRSTNVPRCITSAQGVVTGMFPCDPSPFHVAVRPSAEENLTPNGKMCPRVAELFKESRKRWNARPDGDAPAVVKELRQYLPASAFGDSGFRIDRMGFVPLRDLVVSMHAHGMELPWGLPVEMVHRLDRLGFLQVEAMLRGNSWQHDLEFARVGLGQWLGEVADRFSSVASTTGNGKPTFHLTSAHDTTVMPLLIALGVGPDGWPPYAASVCLELWSEPAAQGIRHVVRVLYEGEAQAVPGCREDGFVPLADFLAEVARVTPTDLLVEGMASDARKGEGCASDTF